MTFSQTVQKELLSQPVRLDEARRFVRDCFLKGGVISNPSRNYHMEFTLSESVAHELMKILESFQLRPKIIARRGQSVVYLKESEEIADVLKIIKANKSLLAMESMRVEKSLRNNINRRVNFEAANLSKTVDAALSQIEAIEYISQRLGLSCLPSMLEDVARLRLDNQEMSLAEIGTLLNPPIGKSGVNHRLRKICKIAENLWHSYNINEGGDIID